MLHDQRAFDRALNPDAAQALDNALEPMVMLLAEQRKPQPSNVDDLRAWRDQIAEYEDQLRSIAERGGIALDDLKAAATRLIAKGGARVVSAETPAPAPRAPRQDPHQARISASQAAAVELERVTREQMEKSQQIVALLREQAVLAKQAAKARKILFVGRGRG